LLNILPSAPERNVHICAEQSRSNIASISVETMDSLLKPARKARRTPRQSRSCAMLK